MLGSLLSRYKIKKLLENIYYSAGNSETSSVKSYLTEDYDITQNIVPLQPVPLTRCSSASSLPNTYNMEESWFVTPPPCFTSSGPVVMRTSPLENLLIEHPSMSVYHIHPRRPFSVRYVATPIYYINIYNRKFIDGCSMLTHSDISFPTVTHTLFLIEIINCVCRTWLVERCVLKKVFLKTHCILFNLRILALLYS